MSEIFGLELHGQTFTGWKSFSCKRSLEAISGKFDITGADRPGFPTRVGDSVRVTVGGEPLLTGFVDRLSKGVVTRELKLEGRDVTGDLVDCSAAVPPFEFQNEGLSSIVAKLCDPFGIAVVLAVDEGLPFERFAVHPGETVFEAIDRGCRLRGLLPTTDGRGRVVLDRPTGTESGVALVEGVNIRDAAIDLDDSGRFHEYRVLSQSLSGADPDDLDAPEGLAFDEGVRAGRILVVVAEGAGSSQDCARRAAWEATSRASQAGRLSVTVQDPRAGIGGPLWRPGLIVTVKIPTLRVEGRKLVTDVEISQDPESGGTVTNLVLARPDSYKLEQEKPRKKDPEAEWGDDVDAEGDDA